MTGSGKGQVTWPWEVDQAFMLEEAPVGWAQFVHPETLAAIIEVTAYQIVCG